MFEVKFKNQVEINGISLWRHLVKSSVQGFGARLAGRVQILQRSTSYSFLEELSTQGQSGHILTGQLLPPYSLKSKSTRRLIEKCCSSNVLFAHGFQHAQSVLLHQLLCRSMAPLQCFPPPASSVRRRLPWYLTATLVV